MTGAACRIIYKAFNGNVQYHHTLNWSITFLTLSRDAGSPAWNHYIWENCLSLCSLSGRGTNLYQRSIFHRCHWIETHWDHFSELLWDLMNAKWQQKCRTFHDTNKRISCGRVTYGLMKTSVWWYCFPQHFASLKCHENMLSTRHHGEFECQKSVASVGGRKMFSMYFGRAMLSTPARHDSSDASSWT